MCVYMQNVMRIRCHALVEFMLAIAKITLISFESVGVWVAGGCSE